jgi:outer membrane beta-barrel protein
VSHGQLVLDTLSFYNDLSPAGKALLQSSSIVPESDWAKSSTELVSSYNLNYGKMRVANDTIVYFDQYFALGFGTIELASGRSDLYSLDLGVAFWVGSNFSTRVGLKNDFFRQQLSTGERFTHNAMGYLEFGYLFGEGTKI